MSDPVIIGIDDINQLLQILFNFKESVLCIKCNYQNVTGPARIGHVG